MADRIIIGAERLPTIEILGKEYPYDVTSATVLKKLKSLTGQIDPTTDGCVQLCREFYTALFNGDPEPAERIGEIYKDSAWLWADAVVQLTPFVLTPKLKTLVDRMGALKKAAEGK